MPPALGAIIADCLASDSKHRPSARQIYDRLSALVPPPRIQKQAMSPQTITNIMGPTPDLPNPPPTPLNIPNEFFPRPRTGLAGALAAASRATNPAPSAAASTSSVLPQLRKPLSPFAAHGTTLSSQPHPQTPNQHTGSPQVSEATNNCSMVPPPQNVVHPSPFAQLTQDPFSSGSNDVQKGTLLRTDSHDAES